MTTHLVEVQEGQHHSEVHLDRIRQRKGVWAQPRNGLAHDLGLQKDGQISGEVVLLMVRVIYCIPDNRRP